MSEMLPAKTPAKHRRYSPEFKARILKECQAPDASVANVALRRILREFSGTGTNWRIFCKTKRRSLLNLKVIGDITNSDSGLRHHLSLGRLIAYEVGGCP